MSAQFESRLVLGEQLPCSALVCRHQTATTAAPGRPLTTGAVELRSSGAPHLPVAVADHTWPGERPGLARSGASLLSHTGRGVINWLCCGLQDESSSGDKLLKLFARLSFSRAGVVF
jgi:hypothetical protein